MCVKCVYCEIYYEELINLIKRVCINTTNTWKAGKQREPISVLVPVQTLDAWKMTMLTSL